MSIPPANSNPSTPNLSIINTVMKEDSNIFSLSSPSHGSPYTPNIWDICDPIPPLTPSLSILVGKQPLFVEPSQRGKLVELNPKAKSLMPNILNMVHPV